MARFRRGGVNWEGRRWYTSVGLNALMDEIEEAYPKAGPADGTVASKNHDKVSPSSDHRPYPHDGSPAVVRAVDAGEDVEDQGIAIAEALRRSRDPRIKYVIHEGRIFSSYSNSRRKAWEWGTYTGANPHSNHVHVSLNSKGDTDGSPWNLNLNQEEDLSVVSEWAKAAWEWAKGIGVLSESSQPKATLTKEEFAVFLQRYDRRVAKLIAAVGGGGVATGAVIAEIIERLAG